MAKSSPVMPFVLVVLSVALGLAGVSAAYLEAIPIFASGFTPDEAFAALADNRLAPGPSTPSKDLVLNDCFTAITSIYGLAQPTDRRNAVLSHCRAIADDIVEEAPSYSFAWLIDAVAAAEIGDIKAFNHGLIRSYVTGPREQWIAELRVDAGEQHFADLEPEAGADHQRDLVLLAQSRRGVVSLAGRYVTDPGFRERVTALLETLALADQQAFLANVKVAAARYQRN